MATQMQLDKADRAVREVFPLDLAAAVIQDEAFGALASQLDQANRAGDEPKHLLNQVLLALEEEGRVDYATGYEHPAALVYGEIRDRFGYGAKD